MASNPFNPLQEILDLVPEVGHTVVRFEYKNARGRVTQLEVEYVDRRIVSIRIGARTYRQQASFALLAPLIASASVDRGDD